MEYNQRISQSIKCNQVILLYFRIGLVVFSLERDNLNGLSFKSISNKRNHPLNDFANYVSK